MTQAPSGGPDKLPVDKANVVDRAEVAQAKDWLLGITSETQYRELVANILREQDPNPVVVEAMRDPELIWRTIDALTSVIKDIDDDIKANRRKPAKTRRDADWERSAYRRQNVYGVWRSSLRTRANADEATVSRRGIPNPRRRAEHRVWQLLLKQQTVTPEMARQILNEEQEAVAARKRAARAAARAAKKSRE